MTKCWLGCLTGDAQFYGVLHGQLAFEVPASVVTLSALLLFVLICVETAFCHMSYEGQTCHLFVTSLKSIVTVVIFGDELNLVCMWSHTTILKEFLEVFG